MAFTSVYTRLVRAFRITIDYSTGMKVPEENDQPDVAVIPPTDEEGSSDDDGPEDPVRTPKQKAASPRLDPPPKTGSPKSKSTSQPVQRICPFCREWPIMGPYEFCSEKCERAAGIAKRKVVFRVLKQFDPNDRIAQAIYQKFCEEWVDPSGTLETPDVNAIYHINLPYYEDRFLDAMQVIPFPDLLSYYLYLQNLLSYKAHAYGGSNTTSAWFGCQCICDVGVKSPDLCNTRSCGICMVIKSGFDELAFGKPTNNGIYGDGIYAHKNPAMAHRFTLRKSGHDMRAVILCSIVELEPDAPVDNVLEHS
ncbi:hypothetical protein FRC01_004180, partial [Tulasnella sp. 417]